MRFRIIADRFRIETPSVTMSADTQRAADFLENLAHTLGHQILFLPRSLKLVEHVLAQLPYPENARALRLAWKRASADTVVPLHDAHSAPAARHSEMFFVALSVTLLYRLPLHQDSGCYTRQEEKRCYRQTLYALWQTMGMRGIRALSGSGAHRLPIWQDFSTDLENSYRRYVGHLGQHPEIGLSGRDRMWLHTTLAHPSVKTLAPEPDPATLLNMAACLLQSAHDAEEMEKPLRAWLALYAYMYAAVKDSPCQLPHIAYAYLDLALKTCRLLKIEVVGNPATQALLVDAQNMADLLADALTVNPKFSEDEAYYVHLWLQPFRERIEHWDLYLAGLNPQFENTRRLMADLMLPDQPEADNVSSPILIYMWIRSHKLFYYYLHRLTQQVGVRGLAKVIERLCENPQHHAEVETMLTLNPHDLTLVPAEFSTQWMEALAIYERARFRVVH